MLQFAKDTTEAVELHLVWSEDFEAWLDTAEQALKTHIAAARTTSDQ